MPKQPHITRLLKESGTLLSGSMAAQGAAFVAYIVLGRLFTPGDFGQYSVFYSYIEVLIILSTAKYELAIVAADSDGEALLLSQGALRLNRTVSALLLCAAAVLAAAHAAPSALPPALMLLIPPMVYFCGTTRVYTHLCNRFRNYKSIAASEVVNSLSSVAARIGFGLLNTVVAALHTLGLPLGTVVGKMVGNLYFRLRLRRSPEVNPILSRPPAFGAFAPLLRKHRNYPRYVMTKDLLTSFSANLPFLWLSLYFGEAALGLFGLAFTFTQRPVNILNGIFEKVFYADSVERRRRGEPIGPAVRRFLLATNAVAVPLCVGGYFVAEPLFVWLMGPRWEGAGYYIRCLLPWLLAMLSSNSLMFVSNLFSTQRVEFCFQLALLVLRVAALGAGILAGSFQLAILLLSGVSTAVLLILLGWYLLQINRYDRSLRQPSAPTAHS